MAKTLICLGTAAVLTAASLFFPSTGAAEYDTQALCEATKIDELCPTPVGIEFETPFGTNVGTMVFE